MRDNVTPFRPRKPQPKPPRLNLQSPRGKAVLVEALVLAAVILSVVPVIPILFTALAVATTWKIPTAVYQLLKLLPMIPGIAALFIAIGNRAAAMPWARTHHEFALRTLIIGASVSTLLQLTLFFPLGPLALVILGLLLVTLLWAFLRAAIGTGLAIFRRPIPHPTGLLI